MAKDNSREKQTLQQVGIDGTMPHQIDAPDFKQSTKDMQAPFVNEHGVVIGDSFYNSANSPLNQWSTETDPSVMAGDEWVHPTNDIGWNSPDNKDLLHDIPPTQPFQHADKDVSYGGD
ncbi:DUF3905 domain-containing protein [Brevibacillus fluminis]|uniref:DUF3905 domain-containing protein n=1 Tax=Brevibacillus fluminis TaxID=511487 RepID=UPI003F89447E